jgi:hypothetical protein
MEIGELINLTRILSVIDKFKSADFYGANNYNYYYAPLFLNSKIVNNIPVITLNSIDEYILMELTIPDNGFINNVNLINITPYFYSYQDVDVFASIDESIEFFKPKVNPGDTIKIVFTSSKTIGTYFKNQGYLISKIPAKYINQSTFNFLIRIGNTDGIYDPGSFITNSKIILNKFVSSNQLIPYDVPDIISTFSIPLSSKYVYNGNNQLLNSLLIYYSKIINNYLTSGYIQIPTYLYLQNIPNPPVKYAFQSFYDAISVNPFIQMQANNTGESYFNSELIDLNNYIGSNLVIIAINQNQYGYGIYSNIQIYNKSGLGVIPNGSYLTSPNIPVISEPSYPYINEKSSDFLKYPLINTQTYNINELLSQGIEQIYIVERIGYNPINFSHSDNYQIPKFSIFVSTP